MRTLSAVIFKMTALLKVLNFLFKLVASSPSIKEILLIHSEATWQEKNGYKVIENQISLPSLCYYYGLLLDPGVSMY